MRKAPVVPVVEVVGPEDHLDVVTVSVYPNGLSGDALEFDYRHRDATPLIGYRFCGPARLEDLRTAEQMLRRFARYLRALPITPAGPGQLFCCLASWLRWDRAKLHTYGVASPRGEFRDHGEVEVVRIAAVLDELAIRRRGKPARRVPRPPGGEVRSA